MIESYLQGLKGVTNILKPHVAKYKPVIEKDKIGMVITLGKKNWILPARKYKTTNALHSAMWSFAEHIWEQYEMAEKWNKTKGKKHE